MCAQSALMSPPSMLTSPAELHDCELPDIIRQVPCRETSRLTNQLDWPSWNNHNSITVAAVEEIVAVPELDTVSQG